MAAVLATDRQGIGKPFGGDKRDRGQVVFDDGIGDHRRAVDQIIDV